MKRGRRKADKRLTVDCILTCLEQNKFPDILKWTDTNGQFSILLRHKRSPSWTVRDIDFFKELDKLSKIKCEKYISQPDYELSCKRRCKANLRKLCMDGIIKFIRKDFVDSSTQIVYYQFLDSIHHYQVDAIQLIRYNEYQLIVNQEPSEKNEENSLIRCNEYQLIVNQEPSEKNEENSCIRCNEYQLIVNQEPSENNEENSLIRYNEYQLIVNQEPSEKNEENSLCIDNENKVKIKEEPDDENEYAVIRNNDCTMKITEEPTDKNEITTVITNNEETKVKIQEEPKEEKIVILEQISVVEDSMEDENLENIFKVKLKK